MTSNPAMTPLQLKLWNLAKKSQAHSHSPYSHKKIGAAVLMDDGQVYGGCNVENASYGGTVCGERVAIFKAISEGQSRKISEVLVISQEVSPWPPCGFCRQVIAEFATPETLVHLTNNDGQIKTYKFTEIFPLAFNPEHLGV